MFITWARHRRPGLSITLNVALAGLVAITAGCDIVTPGGAVIIGIIAGFVLVFGVLSVAAGAMGLGFLLFFILKKTIGIRVSRKPHHVRIQC